MAKTVKHIDMKSYFGDEDHLEVAKTSSFTALIYEMLSENKPTRQQLKVFELILNLSIDHGEETPSAKVVIEGAKNGETISEAVAEGIEEINDSHGGAIEPAMDMFYAINGGELDTKEFIGEVLKSGKKIAGYGHRIYSEVDPRAELILQTLEENGFDMKFGDLAKEVKQELKNETGKVLPLNIDGAIAVVLCIFGWKSRLGKAVFIIARTPGLCAHYLNNS